MDDLSVNRVDSGHGCIDSGHGCIDSGHGCIDSGHGCIDFGYDCIDSGHDCIDDIFSIICFIICFNNNINNLFLKQHSRP